MIKRLRTGMLLAALLSSTAGVPLQAQTGSAKDAAQRPGLAGDPTYGVRIPYEEFTLPNGLRVIVHTDHATPIVAVNIWYHVGSRYEVSGKTGFAHLFEHLMFQGSENYRDEYFRPFEFVGVTDRNGTTTQDRTNYYETVPTPALDLALWMESDRMGHLLGAIDQKTLDEQRGVVQNEKRQRYGQPYGLVIDRLYGAIFPEGHPYHHTPIGSMADLDAASLDDVKGWFKSWYGPNNATLVLAGDIDLATAKEKVTKYFGDIAPSATVPVMPANVPTRVRNTREIFPDKVPQAAIYRAWPSVGERDPDSIPLQLLAQILGGSGSSRLQSRLVQKEQQVTAISASASPLELAGLFLIVAQLKDGTDATHVEAMIDQELRRLIEQGPTMAELNQAKSLMVARFINALPKTATRADLLNQCVTYLGRPDCWKADLAAITAATPDRLKAVARRWLSGGSHTIEVTKSEVPAASRPEAIEPVIERPPLAIPPADRRFHALPTQIDRSSGPPKVTGFPAFSFPAFQRATLSNGMKVVLAERHGAPLVVMLARFPSASTVGDRMSGGRAGRAEGAMAMLTRGAGKYDALQLAARMETLGAGIITGASADDASVIVPALKANLAPTLDLFADILLRPTFDSQELGRFKEQATAGIRAQKSDASKATTRIMPSLLYGPDNPLGRQLTEQDIAALTRDDLAAFMRDRFDPTSAEIIVVGDTTLAEILPMLESRLGVWKGSGHVAIPAIPDTPLPMKPRIYLIDQPGVPQSTIRIAQLVPKGENNIETDALDVGASALGGGFTSRLNMDLREEKHWSYGANSGLAGSGDRQRRWVAATSVQADRTADSMRAMLDQITRLDDGMSPVTEAEVERSRAGLYSLPGTYELNFYVAAGISGLLVNGWPDDYYEQYAARLRAMTPRDATEAFSGTINPNSFTWVVMGPLDKIEAPIRALNLGEVTVIDADGKKLR